MKLIAPDPVMSHRVAAEIRSVILDAMRTQWGHIRRAMLTTVTMKTRHKQFWEEHAAILAESLP
jgi:hypothetical protein